LLVQFLEWLESGARSPRDLLEICRARIAEREPELRAWVEIVQAPEEPAEGPLCGIPFGAKDVFETRGLATEYGSPIYAGRKGERDAAVVSKLGVLGAVLVGKTQTTAFAFFDPAPTRNPRLPGRTPGGSSAGSAAAVAAGMVPLALGSQTLGSVLRPASYCGVCGFKPAFGSISTEGVLPLAPSLDTVGFFTAAARDMAAFWTRSYGGAAKSELRRAAHFALPAAPEMSEAIGGGLERLRASGLRIDRHDLPAGWDELLRATRAVNDYEGARTHEKRYRDFGERIGRKLAELVRTGLAIPEERYAAARDHMRQMRGTMAAVFAEYPLVFSPAATGAAPAGYESTGDPANNAPWTALGTPALSLPIPVPGAPLGLQITAAWDRGDALVAAAAEIEAMLG
jgi:Asp-tRNA(Asn)/Glu-tRNA(Gln) amidotransferase A subunit family amidase